MSVYFDASLIVSLFVIDDLTPRADLYMATRTPEAILSDFAAAEVTSAVSLRVRTRALPPTLARDILVDFDIWRASGIRHCSLASSDVSLADTFLRRLDLPLRAADALHLAMARRLGAALATFDDAMSVSARALGLELVVL